MCQGLHWWIGDLVKEYSVNRTIDNSGVFQSRSKIGVRLIQLLLLTAVVCGGDGIRTAHCWFLWISVRLRKNNLSFDLIFCQKNLGNINSICLTLPYFECKAILLNNQCQKTLFLVRKTSIFDQTYLNTGLKTQNGEKFSIDLILTSNFCQHIKSFSH